MQARGLVELSRQRGYPVGHWISTSIAGSCVKERVRHMNKGTRYALVVLGLSITCTAFGG